MVARTDAEKIKEGVQAVNERLRAANVRDASLSVEGKVNIVDDQNMPTGRQAYKVVCKDLTVPIGQTVPIKGTVYVEVVPGNHGHPSATFNSIAVRGEDRNVTLADRFGMATHTNDAQHAVADHLTVIAGGEAYNKYRAQASSPQP